MQTVSLHSLKTRLHKLAKYTLNEKMLLNIVLQVHFLLPNHSKSWSLEVRLSFLRLHSH